MGGRPRQMGETEVSNMGGNYLQQRFVEIEKDRQGSFSAFFII